MHRTNRMVYWNPADLSILLTIVGIRQNEQVICTRNTCARNILSSLWTFLNSIPISINRLEKRPNSDQEKKHVNSLPTTKFCTPSEILHMNKSKIGEIHNRENKKKQKITQPKHTLTTKLNHLSFWCIGDVYKYGYVVSSFVYFTIFAFISLFLCVCAVRLVI